MTSSIDNIAVWVSDLDRAERIYIDGLGLDVIARINTGSSGPSPRRDRSRSEPPSDARARPSGPTTAPAAVIAIADCMS